MGVSAGARKEVLSSAFLDARAGGRLEPAATSKRAHIAYRLRQFRDDALALEVAVTGERWEIEFLEAREMEISRGNGDVHGAQMSEDLFRRFQD